MWFGAQNSYFYGIVFCAPDNWLSGHLWYWLIIYYTKHIYVPIAQKTNKVLSTIVFAEIWFRKLKGSCPCVLSGFYCEFSPSDIHNFCGNPAQADLSSIQRASIRRKWKRAFALWMQHMMMPTASGLRRKLQSGVQKCSPKLVWKKQLWALTVEYGFWEIVWKCLFDYSMHNNWITFKESWLRSPKLIPAKCSF
jgi:hypothetical protein